MKGSTEIVLTAILSVSTVICFVGFLVSTGTLIYRKTDEHDISRLLLDTLRPLLTALQIIINLIIYWKFRKMQIRATGNWMLIGMTVLFIRGSLFSNVIVSPTTEEATTRKWFLVENNPIYFRVVYTTGLFVIFAQFVWLLNFVRKQRLWFLRNKYFLKLCLSKKTFYFQAAVISLITGLNVALEIRRMYSQGFPRTLQGFQIPLTLLGVLRLSSWEYGEEREDVVRNIATTNQRLTLPQSFMFSPFSQAGNRKILGYMTFRILSTGSACIVFIGYIREIFRGVKTKKSLKRIQQYYAVYLLFHRFFYPFVGNAREGNFTVLSVLGINVAYLTIALSISWCYLTVYVVRKRLQKEEEGMDFLSYWLTNQYKIKILDKRNLTVQYNSKRGSGRTSEVFAGYYTSSRLWRKKKYPVAIKTLQTSYIPKNILEEELCNIARIMISGKNRNLVNFFGACTLEKGSIVIVMELCVHGSLKHFIKEYSLRTTDLQILLIQLHKWSQDAAEGLHHISNLNFLHGDVSARNILVAEDLTAKVSDFGMSRKLYEYELYATLNQAELPWKWMAPEALATLKFTKEGDIWSYGVLLWEIYSLGEEPWNGLMWSSNFVDRLRRGERLDKPKLMDENTNKLMLNCWDLHSEKRPKFDVIIHKLCAVRSTV